MTETAAAADQRSSAIQSAVPREIPLSLALKAVRHWACQEQVAARMGAFHPGDDGYPSVREQVEALAIEIYDIETHRCYFGEDGDSLCGTCGSDPRS